MASTQDIEALAAEIGENIYLDIAKWHLFLAEAHLHTELAAKLYPLLEDNAVSEDGVIAILREIPVKIGGGKKSIPLTDLLPGKCEADLMDLLEEFQRNL
ncbi:Protein of unknown function (DUF3181) [Xenococcus sp. PCC 7305]|uniref:DUF3181 family protein n=1 Tax=Xenococcus sp. PCC 7305 TaxID=102125 RepID=UPI0002AC4608|nr:DUF3181 family protein [Xenococcus sp. PCC 7305]ELS04114.1 Protein of unknown function (DUF3181) [Xenococcus sp. PCC 7305]